MGQLLQSPRCIRGEAIVGQQSLQHANSTSRLDTVRFALSSACADPSSWVWKAKRSSAQRNSTTPSDGGCKLRKRPQAIESKSKVIRFSSDGRDCDNHVVSLNGSATACASDVTVGISGHGFLIASDSLTKHPSGPGMQPIKACQSHCHQTRILVTNRSIPLFPFPHPRSRPSHSA